MRIAGSGVTPATSPWIAWWTWAFEHRTSAATSATVSIASFVVMPGLAGTVDFDFYETPVGVLDSASFDGAAEDFFRVAVTS